MVSAADAAFSLLLHALISILAVRTWSISNLEFEAKLDLKEW